MKKSAIFLLCFVLLLLTACNNRSLKVDPVITGTEYHEVTSDQNIDQNDLTIELPNYYFDELKGKKWYVVGDSYSAGGYGKNDVPEYIEGGLYDGKLAVYSYYIGNRTGMDIHNVSRNGATLVEADSGTQKQWSKDGVYDTEIGSDADYITIWLGANDQDYINDTTHGYNVTLGEFHSGVPNMDDPDLGHTFYGALDKLLYWIINNRPWAKIGLVVSFSLQNYSDSSKVSGDQIAEAIIRMGEKYGIPVLNLHDDPQIPITVASEDPNIPSFVKKIRNNQYMIRPEASDSQPKNTHPNAKYHELESWYIENWLRSL